MNYSSAASRLLSLARSIRASVPKIGEWNYYWCRSRSVPMILSLRWFSKEQSKDAAWDAWMASKARQDLAAQLRPFHAALPTRPSGFSQNMDHSFAVMLSIELGSLQEFPKELSSWLDRAGFSRVSYHD